MYEFLHTEMTHHQQQRSNWFCFGSTAVDQFTACSYFDLGTFIIGLDGTSGKIASILGIAGSTSSSFSERLLRIDFESVRPECKLKQPAVQLYNSNNSGGEPHRHAYAQEERLCFVFPRFNLGRPWEFKSKSQPLRGTFCTAVLERIY